MRKGYAAGCHGKQGFDTPWEAEVYASRTYKDPASLQAYRCKFCKLYHVGHSKFVKNTSE